MLPGTPSRITWKTEASVDSDRANIKVKSGASIVSMPLASAP